MLHSLPALLARLLLSIIFLGAGINKIIHYSATIDKMAAVGVPLPQVALPLAITFLLLGGGLVLLGIRGRTGAWLLIAFLIPVTYYFHPVWSDASQEIAFLKNLSILGGLLMVVVHGTGGLSLDPLFKRK